MAVVYVVVIYLKCSYCSLCNGCRLCGRYILKMQLLLALQWLSFMWSVYTVNAVTARSAMAIVFVNGIYMQLLLVLQWLSFMWSVYTGNAVTVRSAKAIFSVKFQILVS